MSSIVASPNKASIQEEPEPAATAELSRSGGRLAAPFPGVAAPSPHGNFFLPRVQTKPDGVKKTRVKVLKKTSAGGRSCSGSKRRRAAPLWEGKPDKILIPLLLNVLFSAFI